METSEGKPFNAQRFWRIYLPITCAVVLASLFVTYTALCTSMPVVVKYSMSDKKVTGPIEFELTQKLVGMSLSDITVQPSVKGSWQYERKSVVQNDTLVFTPTERLRLGTTYTVKFPNAKRVIGTASIPTARFTTEKAPNLKHSGIAVLSDGDTIAADEELSIEMVATNRNLRQLELRTSPKLNTRQAVANDRLYSWKYEGTLPQGKTIVFEIYDTKNNEILLTRKVHVASAPTLKQVVKPNHFTSQDKARLVFNQAMEPSAEKLISFSIAGNGKWLNDHTYEYTPSSVTPGKTYTYTLKAGMRSQAGGMVVKDQKRYFSTTGAVVVAHTSPHGSQLSQARQSISFTFDQPVNHTATERLVSVSSGKIISKTWSGNTLYLVATNLGYQRTVTARVTAGVKNSGFGLPSTRAFTLSFTTEYRVIKLNVPYYKQQHSATCTAASLRMILAHYGVSASETGIVSKMGYSPRKMDTAKSPDEWDDPSKMFVGSIDGSIGAKTAAGPDAPPVAKAAIAYGRSASAVRGVSAAWMAQQIYAGHPVVMFGAVRGNEFITWKTPSGIITKMNRRGHATVVYGVTGAANNPISFMVHDPYYGTSSWSTAEVTANISRDAYRQAVVVY